MIADHILLQLAYTRQLKVGKFDLKEAIASGKPVYFWHSFNGLGYSAYELLPSNSFESNIGIGTRDQKEAFKDQGVFLGLASRFFFVEHDGLITNSSLIWPDDLVLWLGDALPDMYRLELNFVKRNRTRF